MSALVPKQVSLPSRKGREATMQEEDLSSLAVAALALSACMTRESHDHRYCAMHESVKRPVHRQRPDHGHESEHDAEFRYDPLEIESYL